MTMNFPNTLRVYTITTSLGEEISLSASTELQARNLFMRSFPRKRMAAIREIPQDPANFV